jgi:hypothetical protein
MIVLKTCFILPDGESRKYGKGNNIKRATEDFRFFFLTTT